MTVNYNTRRLIAQLVYSLYRTLRSPEFSLVVVDNGSTDGSAELLSAVAAAGLCHLIANPENRYHGPGLNQGVSYLAEATRRGDAVPISYVWLLDSDCVVLRPDALSTPCRVMRDTGAALAGQRGYGRADEDEPLGLHSLLIDPAQVWQPAIQPFQDHGLPSEALQRSRAQAGLLAVDFPCTRGGCILHIGRGSLRVIAETGDRPTPTTSGRRPTTSRTSHWRPTPGRLCRIPGRLRTRRADPRRGRADSSVSATIGLRDAGACRIVMEGPRG